MLCNCIYEKDEEMWFHNMVSDNYKKGYYRIINCSKGLYIPWKNGKKYSRTCEFRCAAGQISLFDEVYK